MGRVLELQVGHDAGRPRTDLFLCDRLPAESRASIQKLIRSGRVRREGTPLRPSSRLHPGDRLILEFPEPALPSLVGEAIPLEVVHEDPHLLVVLKPAGMVVHPGAGVARGTLVHALLGRERSLSAAGGKDRPGIVHRLDKETSGLLLVARDDATHRALASQFAERTIVKRYLALVWGHPAPARGTIEAALGRHPIHRTRMAVRASGGRLAVTDYETREILGPFSLLELRIHTGRTHQIRVHLKHRGHPVAGDSRYGGAGFSAVRSLPLRRALQDFGRLALHAWRLEFSHPISGERIRLEAPPPADFTRLLEEMRSLR